MKISKDKKLCEEYMGKHPVISISLKGINAASYEAAFELTVKTIKGAVQKAGFLKMSDKLGEDEKKEYRAILDENMSEATLFWSLKNLSELLEKHYETKVILLIDEYDVPLAKAFENGYYDKMVFLIRNLLEQTLKTNNSLKFAVMTGCMRISKESIFTGLNNLKVLSITDGWDVWFHVLSPDYGFRPVGSAAEGLSGYGIQPDCDHAHSVGRPEQSNQIHQAHHYGAGSFQD